jgi:hypothetical protein
MGSHVFTRTIKGSAEGAWWPSKVGAIAPEAVAKMSMGALALASCLPAVKRL